MSDQLIIDTEANIAYYETKLNPQELAKWCLSGSLYRKYFSKN